VRRAPATSSGACVRVAALLLLGAVAALRPAPAWAECECRCVNGENVAVCTRATDVPPVCPPRPCPRPPPGVRPVTPPAVPPTGTGSCRMEQVYDEASGKYEWRQVCR